MTTGVNSRITVLDTPILPPGVCSLCGTSGHEDKRKFIDFGKQLDWYGAVYFCSECIKEVSEAIGFIPVAGFNILHDRYRALNIKYDQLLKENQALKDAFANILAPHPSTDDVNIDNGITVLSVEESESVDESAISDAGREQETSESDSFAGSDDLHDSSDFE